MINKIIMGVKYSLKNWFFCFIIKINYEKIGANMKKKIGLAYFFLENFFKDVNITELCIVRNVYGIMI